MTLSSVTVTLNDPARCDNPYHSLSHLYDTYPSPLHPLPSHPCIPLTRHHPAMHQPYMHAHAHTHTCTHIILPCCNHRFIVPVCPLPHACTHVLPLPPLPSPHVLSMHAHPIPSPLPVSMHACMLLLSMSLHACMCTACVHAPCMHVPLPVRSHSLVDSLSALPYTKPYIGHTLRKIAAIQHLFAMYGSICIFHSKCMVEREMQWLPYKCANISGEHVYCKG